MVMSFSLANRDRSHPIEMQGMTTYVTLKLGMVTTRWNQAHISHNLTLRILLFGLSKSYPPSHLFHPRY